MANQPTVTPAIGGPITTPNPNPTTPGTTTPGARLTALVAAYAVAMSPAGASASVPMPATTPLAYPLGVEQPDEQLCLLDASEVK